jgi:small-conductance mechanosensitive channel
MKLMFTVPFNTDPNMIKKIFKKIGNDMIADPDLGAGFLEPFKSQGVLEFNDIGMVIRGKFMAKPGAQFTIRKEINNRVQDAFRDAGIEFARREVRVAIPGYEDTEHLTEAEKTAVTAVAAEAVNQSVSDQVKK